MIDQPTQSTIYKSVQEMRRTLQYMGRAYLPPLMSLDMASFPLKETSFPSPHPDILRVVFRPDGNASKKSCDEVCKLTRRSPVHSSRDKVSGLISPNI